MSLPVALSIAGSDSGGGAGIQADLLSFAANGVYGSTAITCVTAQNPNGVTGIQALEPKLVCEQIKQVLNYFPVSAIKTGMLFSAEIIEAVSALLNQPNYVKIPLIVDPVMIATSGSALLEDNAVEAMTEKLFSRANLLTPNLDEAKALLGEGISNIQELKSAAKKLSERHQTAVLLKGGHLEGPMLYDFFYDPSGQVQLFEHTRENAINTHGSGCTLASAITANVAKGKPLSEAVSAGIDYLQSGIIQRVVPETRESFINHFPQS